MLDIRYLPGIHIFIFALTLYYSYFIISMSLYLPFIPEHLISTYPINILTHSYKNKHTIPISIYILYYSITISLHHHSIHTHLYSIHLLSYLAIPILSHYLTHSSINHYSTIFYSHLHYHHSTTTQIYHSIPSKIRRRRYIFFQLFIIIISIIILLVKYNSILFYLFSFIYYTYLYSYSYYIHHLLTIPPLYPILLYTHRHIDRHTQIHIDRHIVKFNSL